MKKYKVRFYEDARVNEKTVEANGFHILSNSGGKTAIFTATDGTEIHAFSDFIRVEKL